MRTRITVLFTVVLMTGVLTAFAAPANGSEPIDEIDENTTLTEDHMGGIAFKEDNITLDCDGYSIIEDHRSDEGVGILIEGLEFVTVKDCVVVGFKTGVHLTAASHSVIQNTISRSTEIGFFVGILAEPDAGSHHITLKRNKASGANVGFIVNGSHDNTLVKNHASRNAFAGFIVESGSDGNTLIRNKSTKNDRYGFLVQSDSGDNLLKRNIATSNVRDGIIIYQAAPGNEFTRNRANSNGRFGLQILATSETLIAKNVMNANGWSDPNVYAAGIYVENANGNLFTRNIANGNLMNGIRVVDGSSNNVFTSNKACGNRDVDALSDIGLVNTWNPDNHFCTSLNIE
jgi:parallel beta-helix repeat protein